MEFFSKCNLAFSLEPECWLKRCTCTFQRRFVAAPKLEGRASPIMEWFLPKESQVSNSFCALPWLWMAAVIPPGSGLAVCVPIHSSPKEGLQVHAQSAAAPREPGAGQLCWIGHFLQWSWKEMWTGRNALETIPPSQAEGKHCLERFILQPANPANANPAFETGLLINKASRGLLTAALKTKTKRKKEELWFHSPVCFDCRLEIPGLPVIAPHSGRIFRFHPATDALMVLRD